MGNAASAAFAAITTPDMKQGDSVPLTVVAQVTGRA